MNVAILGGGASGLMAGWAVINAGHCPRIFDKHPGPPNPQAGFFYLHEPCDLPLKPKTAQVLMTGAPWGDNLIGLYRKKVYQSEDLSLKVSLEQYMHSDTITVYDGGQALNLLWDIAGPFVHDGGAFSWDELCGTECWADAQRIISTIPLSQFLPEAESIWSLVKQSSAPPDECYVMYNVNSCVPWHRATGMFGRFCLEYSEENQPIEKQLVPVRKVLPLVVDMQQWLQKNTPEHLLLAGRYGKWDKSTLLSDVYREVLEWLP